MTINLTKIQTKNLLKHEFQKCKECKGKGWLYFPERGMGKNTKPDCAHCLGTGTQLFVIEDEGKFKNYYQEYNLRKKGVCYICGKEAGKFWRTVCQSHVPNKLKGRDKSKIMYCSICGSIDDSFTAYCLKDGRVPHKIKEIYKTYPILDEAKEGDLFRIIHWYRIIKLTEEKGIKKVWVNKI